MPTFTTVALENLLHHGVRDPPKKPVQGDRDEPVTTNGGSRHLYIMPALYSTPEQAPIPENAAAHSPSPYVVNHKRRGWGNEGSGLPELPSAEEGGRLGSEAEEVDDNFFEEDFVGGPDFSVEDELLELEVPELHAGKEVNQSAGNGELNELNRNEIDPKSYASAAGEFFDAVEDFSSDGLILNSTPSESNIEIELHMSRSNLLEEIERRKAAEETLTLMCDQWESIRKCMSEAGLSFPAFEAASNSAQFKNDLVEQISIEVLVTKFVAEAVGRGQAHAEAEEAASLIMESKDQELLRLRDRLQYYETVNHELSQRNLVEVARRHQERKRSRRRRWLWGFMALSIATVGASAVAYLSIPQVGEHLSIVDSSNSFDNHSSTG